MLKQLCPQPRLVPIPLDGRRRRRPDPDDESSSKRSWVLLLIAGLLLALVLNARASSRGPDSRVEIWTDQVAMDAGSRYSIHLLPERDGFVYVYSLDARGTVRLLYPVQPEDGRGQVQAGNSFSIEPVIAGSLPGREQLVAVHTLEYRRIKASRQEFLAPDPLDLADIHFRMTRDSRELDNWAVAELTIDGPAAYSATDVDEDGPRPGIMVHEVHYDYWCDYCNCWHPTCTLDHCWCDWRVNSYYYGHYHHHHCGWWGPRHWWWDSPVVYIYIQGGSRWDYDTSPWRDQEVWRRQRHWSQDWRQRLVQEVDRGQQPREQWPPAADAVFQQQDLRKVLKEVRASDPPPAIKPRVWTTRPESSGKSGSSSSGGVFLPGRDNSSGKGGKTPVPVTPRITPQVTPQVKPQVAPAPKPSAPDADKQVQPAKPQVQPDESQKRKKSSKSVKQATTGNKKGEKR